jgi:hypothetical protein
MKRKENIIPIILISFACILFIIAIVLLLNTNHFVFSNKKENKESMEKEIKEEDSNNSNDILENSDINTDSDINVDSNQNTTTSVDNNSNIVSSDNTDDNINNNQSTDSDFSNIVSYFESYDNMITSNTNQDDSTLREKAKNGFTTIVDFIFYGKEVKGYTFNELTTSAKLKIIKLALSIDYKIDEYFPDYKDVIKDNYTNIKGKLAVKYLEFTSDLCDSVGSDTCNQAKEDFNNMKNSFGFTWQLIKELASSGSSKVKEFYESWRDSE